MKKYVISGAISKSGGNPKSTDFWDFYEDFIEFECSCDDDARSYAEALQQRHDSLFLEKFPEEVHFTNWDFAPCYINHLYEIGVSGDLLLVE